MKVKDGNFYLLQQRYRLRALSPPGLQFAREERSTLCYKRLKILLSFSTHTSPGPQASPQEAVFSARTSTNLLLIDNDSSCGYRSHPCTPSSV